MDAISEQHLSRLADSLGATRREVKTAAATARANPFDAKDEPGVWDDHVAIPVKTASFSASKNWRVAAVDGGVIARELHGSVLSVLKACAVEFTYLPDGSFDVKSGVRAWPGKRVPIMVSTEYGLDSTEFHWFVNLSRLRLEIQAARRAIEQFTPDVLLLGGSIVPQPADKPREHSILNDAYAEVVESFKALYQDCEKNNVLLAGVNKDSRGKQLTHYLPHVIPALAPFRARLERLGDSVFLSELLKEGERSFAFAYSQATDVNPIMRDLGPWAKTIASYYLRPSALDRPVRVDLFLPELLKGQKGAAREKVNASASWLSRLCAINARYAYPAVLIEADLRAAVRPDEFERVLAQLKTKTGANNPVFFELRRNSRPFR
ncbi:NurA domain protein [uncultured archaeon]|nr:NurA domain protein [uncultured archaeon]